MRAFCCRIHWNEYLDHLAVLISNLRMAYDMDIILGGDVGGVLSDYMIPLGEKVMAYNGLSLIHIYDDVDLRNFGGQKKKRTAFAQSDTGKQIMTAMIDAVRRKEAVSYTHLLLKQLKKKDSLSLQQNSGQ